MITIASSIVRKDTFPSRGAESQSRAKLDWSVIRYPRGIFKIVRTAKNSSSLLWCSARLGYECHETGVGKHDLKN